MTERNYTIDILKLIMLTAICIFHSWEFTFFNDLYVLRPYNFITFALEAHARTFSIGGQVIVFLIFFLFGFRSKSRKALLRISAFALVGQLALAWAFMDQGTLLTGAEWDVYAFIALTSFLVALTPEVIRRSKIFLLLSILLMLISPRIYQDFFPPGYLGDVLTGRYTDEHTGSWGMFPWFFFTYLGYHLGYWVRENTSRIAAVSKPEWYIWALLLGGSLPYLGAYYHTPIGPGYYSFTYSQSSFIFFSNFIPYLFLLRISFKDGVNDWLGRKKIVQFLSHLAWVRNTGWCYVFSVVYIGVFIDHLTPSFADHPWTYGLIQISVIPLTEAVVRVFSFGRRFLTKQLSHLR